MRAILIDPFERKIQEVDFDGELFSAHKLMDCSLVEAMPANPFGNSDNILLDEEGRLKSDRHQEYFELEGWHEGYLCGRALIVGSDGAGEMAEALTDIEDVRRTVIWLEKVDEGGTAYLMPVRA